MKMKLVIAVVIGSLAWLTFTELNEEQPELENPNFEVVSTEPQDVRRARSVPKKVERPKESDRSTPNLVRENQPQSGEGPTIIGRVVDSENKPAPLPRANLWDTVTGRLIASGLGSSQGSFALKEIKDLPKNEMLLEVTVDSVGRALRRFNTQGNWDFGDIRLDEGESISGRIKDPNGRPLPQVRIWALPTELARHQQLFPISEHIPPHKDTKAGLSYTLARTEKDGTFTVKGLKPGKYFFVSAEPGAMLRNRGSSYKTTDDNVVLTMNATKFRVWALNEKGEPIEDAAFSFKSFRKNEIVDGETFVQSIDSSSGISETGEMEFLLPDSLQGVVAVSHDGAFAEVLIDRYAIVRSAEVKLQLTKPRVGAGLKVNLVDATGKRVEGLEYYGTLCGKMSRDSVVGFDELEFDDKGRCEGLPEGQFRLEIEYSFPGEDSATVVSRNLSFYAQETTEVTFTLGKRIKPTFTIKSGRRRNPMLSSAHLCLIDLDNRTSDQVHEWSGVFKKFGRDWRQLVDKRLTLPWKLTSGRYRVVLRGVKNQVLFDSVVLISEENQDLTLFVE